MLARIGGKRMLVDSVTDFVVLILQGLVRMLVAVAGLPETHVQFLVAFRFSGGSLKSIPL